MYIRLDASVHGVALWTVTHYLVSRNDSGAPRACAALEGQEPEGMMYIFVDGLCAGQD